MPDRTAASQAPPAPGRERTRFRYIALIIAVLCGVVLGFAADKEPAPAR